MAFVHLHVHTTCSLLDGAIKVRDLVARAAELGMPAVAVTDHGNMSAAVRLQQTCDEYGIKPIFGTEFYFDPVSRNVKDKQAKAHHLILLAKDNTGLKSLMRLNTIAHLEGMYRKPRIDYEVLSTCQGLICLTACLKSELAYYWLQENDAELEAAIDSYLRLFGDDFYLELGAASMEEQVAYNTFLLEIAQRRSIPVVVTCDAHYLTQADAYLHDALLCLQTNSKLTDPNRLHLPTDEYYIWSPEEIKQWCRRWQVNEAMTNTLDIADKCHARLDTSRIRLPHFTTPA